eukprot:TRINITY_DN3874_c0_g2_i1.p1 TRINITY_DN3874_c0_g2~~TRINITY_DN3874_c0_g2_i1.p1  ORF type:complete len:579 (-),score=88.85 TRINITY_DN3874_c0_g2_i1:550-2286(-)
MYRGSLFLSLAAIAAICMAFAVASEDEHPLRRYQSRKQPSFFDVLQGARPMNPRFKEQSEEILTSAEGAEGVGFTLTIPEDEQDHLSRPMDHEIHQTIQGIDIANPGEFEPKNVHSANATAHNDVRAATFSQIQNTSPASYARVVKLLMVDGGCTGSGCTLGHSSFSCSGSLVGPYHVLTAGHCCYVNCNLEEDSCSTSRWITTMYVIPRMTTGYVGNPTSSFSTTNRPFGIGIGTSFWLFTSSFQTATENNFPLYDRCLVTLDRPLGTWAAWENAHPSSVPSVGTALSQTGYPGVEFNGLNQIAKSGGTISSVSGNSVRQGNYVCQGDSGSTVWSSNGIIGVCSSNLCPGTASSCCVYNTITSTLPSADWTYLINAVVNFSPPTVKANVIELVSGASGLKGVASSSYTAGSEMTVTFSLVNKGGASSGTISVRFYAFSSLDTFSSLDYTYELSLQTASSLGAGQSLTYTSYVNAPSASGPWTIGMTFTTANAQYTRDISFSAIWLDTITVTSAAPTVYLYTSPSWCGSVTFRSYYYTNGDYTTTTTGAASISASACSGYRFSRIAGSTSVTAIFSGT